MGKPGCPVIEDVSPQRGPMIFLTEFVHHTKDNTTCVVAVGENVLCRGPGGFIPGWI